MQKQRKTRYATLAARMDERGLSYEGMARLLGVALGTINNRMRGNTPWTLDEAIRVARAMEWDGKLEDLFRWE